MTSRRYFCDSIEVAAQLLHTVLTDARATDSTYKFGGITPKEIYSSGLLLTGEIDEVSRKLDALDGVQGEDE